MSGPEVGPEYSGVTMLEWERIDVSTTVLRSVVRFATKDLTFV
jgi:hypothetical protein